MKRYLIEGLLFITICFFGQKALAQSTTLTPGGILPSMTTEQRTDLINPPNGMLVFDSNTQSYWFRQSGAWVELPKGGSTSNYWELNGLAGNELKNTNSGGFWSANTIGLNASVDNSTHPPRAPMNGNGTRLMWIPSRSALRVGTVDNVNSSSNISSKAWDADSIGLFSFAIGYNITAKGNFSNAIGAQSTASGYASTVVGVRNRATGYGSIAMGVETMSSGLYATAMGYKTDATGFESTAMGQGTLAAGQNSTAMGAFSTASGVNSTATGFQTIASGRHSMASGEYTVAKTASSFTLGKYNDDSDSPDPSQELSTDRLFQIGNGRAESRTNALTILRDGRIGINNINSPLDMLHIKGKPNENVGIRLELGNSTNHAQFTASSNSFQLRSPGAGFFSFVSQSNGLLAQLTDLGLGIGNVLPVAPLHLANGPNTWERHIRLDFNAATSEYGNIVYDGDGMKFRTWGDGDDFYFRNSANTSVARIKNTGNMTIAGTLTQNSDRRLKTNLTKVQNSGNKLAQLQAYHYNWKAADSDPSLQTGLIAQEVQKQFPELVNEGENGYLSVNYIGLIPHLIESHKELKAVHEELKERLQKIEEKLSLDTQTASIK